MDLGPWLAPLATVIAAVIAFIGLYYNPIVSYRRQKKRTRRSLYREIAHLYVAMRDFRDLLYAGDWTVQSEQSFETQAFYPFYSLIAKDSSQLEILYQFDDASGILDAYRALSPASVFDNKNAQLFDNQYSHLDFVLTQFEIGIKAHNIRLSRKEIEKLIGTPESASRTARPAADFFKESKRRIANLFKEEREGELKPDDHTKRLIARLFEEPREGELADKKVKLANLFIAESDKWLKSKKAIVASSMQRLHLEDSEFDLYKRKILYARGSAFRQLYRYDEALGCFEDILSQNKTDVPALVNKGRILSHLASMLTEPTERKKRLEKALEETDKALALSPNDVDALATKGHILSELGDKDKALEVTDKALALNPEHVLALSNKGAILSQRGDNEEAFEEALKWLDKALALDPDYVHALFLKGSVLCQLHRNKEALTWTNKALALNPKQKVALSNKGAIEFLLGHYEDALYWTNKALALSPDYADALSNKGWSLSQLSSNFRDLSEALTWTDKALALNPNHVDALACKGSILLELGQKSQAKKYIEEALALNPLNVDALRIKGAILWDSGDQEGGMGAVCAALKIDPSNLLTRKKKESMEAGR